MSSPLSNFYKICLLFVLFSITETKKGKCKNNKHILSEFGVSKPLSEKSITLLQKKRKLFGSSHPFKIHVDTSNVRGVSSELREYLLNLVVWQGNRIFADKIKIGGNQYIEGDRNIQRFCSYDRIIQIPDSYAYDNIEADFILFLATDDTGNDGTLAYATACNLEYGTNRPNVGFAVFNPYYIDPAKGKLDNDVATYVHEVLHALVFSSQLWAKFPLVSGQPQYFVKNGGHYLRGQNLLNVTRNHFQCSKINAVPLEDDGGDGSKGGHFERIVFGDETMVAEDVEVAKFSKITLALMKDSGWYDIDVMKGDAYTWGKGEGCELFYKTCTQSSVDETCDQNNNFGCDKTFHYKMSCRKTTFTGGCNIKTKGFSCLKHHSNMYFFENAGEDSRCQTFEYKGNKYAGCVNITCSSSRDSYQVTLGGDDPVRFTCQKENQVFKWGSNFVFNCENPNLICNNLCPKNCYNRGKCLENGKCACDAFYSGEICGTFAGCGNLSSDLCNKVIKSNGYDTQNYSNSYSSADFDSNYLSYSSWTDEGSSSTSTDTGYNSNTGYNTNTSSNTSYNNTGGSGSSVVDHISGYFSGTGRKSTSIIATFVMTSFVWIFIKS
jgi:hypothetical protein